ncbi:CLUMA_CG015677, isoform A [Clunio marinus]|uniref:CLUMA_CG015677, isoform A n=1 Tax=Clunio marinus TaxID=568069 RepID=A0A1J1IUZ4_9DIPT|nr:CLUMA_CG015677, isoform A [Clunio marinus]
MLKPTRNLKTSLQLNRGHMLISSFVGCKFHVDFKVNAKLAMRRNKTKQSQNVQYKPETTTHYSRKATVS